jgi:two-component system invasion response regulator UvrY
MDEAAAQPGRVGRGRSGIMSEQIKVLVIEDHPIVRDGCRQMFGRRADIALREADTAEAGLAENREFQPDIVILDVGLGNSSGFDIMPPLLAENKAARIIVFSMYEAPRFATRALELGARGYVTKNDDPKVIVAAIDKVRHGGIYLGPSIAQALALANVAPAPDPLRDLTTREREVVALLGNGQTLTEIAAVLDISYKSAANMIAAIKQKLGIGSSPALIKFAVELKAAGS